VRVTILEVSDSNMAGDHWTTSFILAKQEDGSLTLSCQQDGEYPIELDPATDITTGVALYEALRSMMSEVGYGLEDYELDELAERISPLSTSVADNFRNAPRLIQEAAKQEAERREALYDAHRDRIEAFLESFSDQPRRQAPSDRGCAAWFIRQHLGEHGNLPSGPHLARLPGFDAGPIDFTGL